MHILQTILLVRDPAERAWSEYKFFKGHGTTPSVSVSEFHTDVLKAINVWRNCRRNAPMEVCVHDVTVNNVVPRLNIGMYTIHIKKWLHFFPRKQVLVLSSEFLANKPRQAYEEMFRFLDVPSPSPALWSAILTSNDLNVNWREGDLRPLDHTMALLQTFYRQFTREFTDLMRSHNYTHAFHA